MTVETDDHVAFGRKQAARLLMVESEFGLPSNAIPRIEGLSFTTGRRFSSPSRSAFLGRIPLHVA